MSDLDDRTLLERAAKAAGYEIEPHPNWRACRDLVFSLGGRSWNPLTDDGDAFRLMVDLGLDIEWRPDGRVACYRHANADGHCYTAFESSRENKKANARRAIVRAAAAMGGSDE